MLRGVWRIQVTLPEEKNKTFKLLFWVIKLELQTSKAFFIWTILNNLYNGAGAILNTYAVAELLANVTTVVFRHTPTFEVYKWLGILLVLQLINLASSSYNSVFERRFQQQMEVVLNQRLFTKMYELSQEQFDDQSFNTKLARATDSVNSIWRVLSQLSLAVSSSIQFVGSVAIVMFVSPVVGIIIVASVIPVSYLRIRQNKLYEETSKKVEPIERVSRRSFWMLTDPEHMPEIRLMNAFNNLLISWHKNLKKAQDIAYANEKRMTSIDMATGIAEPAVSFGANIYFFKLLLGGTIGISRFIFLRGLLEQASSSAIGLATSFDQLHELMIGMQNFNEVYETPPAILNGTVKVERPMTIKFDNVSFTYPGATQTALQDVSFLIVPGSQLALVGENGAGKTTLIKLLLRQYLPTQGSITVNGTDIKDVEQESYYAAISNLSQDFLVVTHLTIKDNLTMGLNREVPQKEIVDATDLVDSTGFIEKLPHKFNQRLDSSFDDGSNLSGGQYQRLGVARALLRHGDIMILDEPTSAIDAKAEYLIFNNVYKAHAGKTTLIVSHRFSTVRKADKVIVMKNGRIIEYGSHEGLLKYGGLYKEMFEAQAEGYK
jgi:ABC-type multidrug transport system fused ATPase/permease subunit